jgi:hypothetical protein
MANHDQRAVRATHRIFLNGEQLTSDQLARTAGHADCVDVVTAISGGCGDRSVGRWCAYRVPVDTSLFTPLHLQPTAACRLAFNAAGLWLRHNVLSHRRLVREHRTGLVIWSVQLVYGDRITFFDADELEVRVAGRIRGRGTQFECRVEIRAPTGTPTRLSAWLIPLRLGEDGDLLGTPARLGPDVAARFRAEEVDDRPHTSPVPRLRASITREAGPLALGRTPFTVHRHQCEVADQWFWAEAVSLSGSGREELVRAEAERLPRLRQAMRAPPERLDVLFERPYYLFDRGEVVSTAYDWRGKLAFVHELFGAGNEGEGPRALAIEQFPDGPRP